MTQQKFDVGTELNTNMFMHVHTCVYGAHNELLSEHFSYEDGDQHPKAKQAT